ncbi:hypothetical protein IHE45_13G066300 [Dioscorea alata]|uniref:Uncharacterized protein n=1 Tax=Dioscorea alata TaxID=55571 RepID=A0ACB7UYN4_DIOAL|nr:hypothetical protein IHE45_13G066300 [Dioscorea alata]
MVLTSTKDFLDDAERAWQDLKNNGVLRDQEEGNRHGMQLTAQIQRWHDKEGMRKEEALFIKECNDSAITSKISLLVFVLLQQLSGVGHVMQDLEDWSLGIGLIFQLDKTMRLRHDLEQIEAENYICMGRACIN